MKSYYHSKHASQVSRQQELSLPLLITRDGSSGGENRIFADSTDFTDPLKNPLCGGDDHLRQASASEDQRNQS